MHACECSSEFVVVRFPHSGGQFESCALGGRHISPTLSGNCSFLFKMQREE